MSNTTSAATVVVRPRVQGILAALIQADFLALVKNRRSFLMGLLVPLALLIATGRQQSQQRLGGSLFVVGLSLTIGLISTSILGYALAVARDRDAGIFQRLRVTPAPTWTIMVSRLSVQVVANLIIAVVVVVAGTIIDHVSLTAGQAALMLAISILAGAVYLSIGQALVGLVKSAETVNATGRVLYIALTFVGLLGVSGVLGSAIESISRWSPVGTVMTLFGAAADVSAWNGRDMLSLVVCVVYAAVFAGIGIYWFQWDAR